MSFEYFMNMVSVDIQVQMFWGYSLLAAMGIALGNWQHHRRG